MKGRRIDLLILVLLLNGGSLFAQKTLVLEKISSNRHFFFRVEDPLKVRLQKPDTLLSGTLWSLTDTSIDIVGLRHYTAQLQDIRFVYRKFPHVKKIGINLLIVGFIYAGVVSFNHLINNEQVITPDVWIVPAGFVAVSGISFSFYKKRYKIGLRWKLKVLDVPVWAGE